MLFVVLSISPVPYVLPAATSYFQSVVLRPVLAAPVKSSLHVRVKPDGGAGTPAGAVAMAGALLGLAGGFTIRAASEQPAIPSANSTRRRFMGPPMVPPIGPTTCVLTGFGRGAATARREHAWAGLPCLGS